MILQNWQWMFVYPAVVLAIMETLWIVSRKRPGFGHRTAIVTSLVVRLIYLVWRVFFTIPTDAWWDAATGLVLLAVEVIGFAQSVTVYATLWRPHSGGSVWLPRADKLPSVDVFIATYNEPVSMLRMTIAGAVSMRYPRDAVRIFVCTTADETKCVSWPSNTGQPTSPGRTTRTPRPAT
ncbi:hypothetical protein [Cryobacterium algoritolerans]|uniref:hypothetical protein n=1 Tax=Cryobacterium algoritolerans TaxID=1259184 RepID=UPI00106C50C5|nr:hypothetical protein [Cryobacterium algoritolerans]